MQFIFLFTFLVLTSALPPNLEEDVNDNEIVVRHFDKCSPNEYYDIFESKCLQCTPCKPSEFVVFGCKPFDNYVCSTCESNEYKGTAVYKRNCIRSPVSMPFRLRDGMTSFGRPDKDTPFKIVSNDHLSTFDEDDSDEDILPKLPPLVSHHDEEDDEDDNSIDESDEVLPKLPQPVSKIDNDDDDDDEDDDDEELLPKLPRPVFEGDDDDDDEDDDDEEPLPKLPRPVFQNDDDDDDDNSDDDDDNDKQFIFFRYNRLRLFRLGNRDYENMFRGNFNRGQLAINNNIEDDSDDSDVTEESAETMGKVNIINSKLPTIQEESSESSASDETSSDDDDGSSSDSDSNSDSNSASSSEEVQSVEVISEMTVSKTSDLGFSNYRLNQTTLFLIVIGFKLFLIYLVVTRCCRRTYRHKTVTVLHIPEMSPEDNGVLLRAVGFLEDKYRHNGKYQRLIGEDV